MPFHPEHSLLNVNLDKMHTIDTRSVEDLYGLWAVFSKASNVLEDGKRLENLSWRLWNRETFCCCPETKARSTHKLSSCKIPSRSQASVSDLKTPELASSLESVSSDDAVIISQSSPVERTSADVTRPELTRLSSLDDRSRGREKHITSGALEKIVTSITQQQTIEPLSELPPLAQPAVMMLDAAETASHPLRPARASKHPSEFPCPSNARPSEPQTLRDRRLLHTTPIIVEQPADSQRHRVIPQSSASTVLTQESRTSSQTSESPNSPATSMSTHNVIRGFVPGGTSSYRSQTQLAPEPIPIKKAVNTHSRTKKGACFMLGTSSESQDDGSIGSFQKQSLRTGRRLTQQSGSSLKQESLADEDLKRKVQSSPVFESDAEEDDGDDDDVDDEDDEDEDDIDEDEEGQDASDWEDEAVVDEDDSPARTEIPRQTSLFRRVDSRPSLTSHRSLLTSMMHEGDRVRDIAAQAKHSRTETQMSASSPSAPPRRRNASQDTKTQGLAIGLSQPQAINVPSSGGGNVALSPRSTRRNMLATELTESLRRNLLWERQQKARGGGTGTNNLRRRHTALDVKKLSQQQQEATRPRMSRSQYQDNNFDSNEYLHTGLEEYHAKGW